MSSSRVDFGKSTTSDGMTSSGGDDSSGGKMPRKKHCWKLLPVLLLMRNSPSLDVLHDDVHAEVEAAGKSVKADCGRVRREDVAQIRERVEPNVLHRLSPARSDDQVFFRP